MRDWDRHYQGRRATDATPAEVLTDNAHLLPASGKALDVACGLGGNAVFLARHGLTTTAWDSSATAIDELAAHAHRHRLPLVAHPRDVVEQPPPPQRFDVVVVSRFLERSIAGALAQTLCPHGLLFYQTFTRHRGSRGPANERYRLADNELLTLFAPLRVLVYREAGCAGDPTARARDEAQLVAQRPADRAR